MTDSISTVPEVHTILTKNTYDIDRYKDYDKHNNQLYLRNTAQLPNNTHNTDRHKTMTRRQQQ